MKGYYCILSIALFCAEIVNTCDEPTKPQNDREGNVPNESEPVNLLMEKRIGGSKKSVSSPPDFWLYTKQNRESGQKIDMQNSDEIERSNFNASNPTRFIIHGWSDNVNTIASILIRSSYLDRQNFNIFLIDWSNGVPKKSYIAAWKDVIQTAGHVTDYILFLKEKHHLSLDNSYLIGHNLGAHVAGLVGKRLKTQNNTINAIIGLDPAWPLYSIDRPESRLSRGDAKFVLTIQTCGGQLGFHWPIGDAVFYPNWGRMQPACSYDSTGHCSDGLAVQYFALSLLPKNDFLAKQCDSYDNIRNEKCKKISENDQFVEMGGDPLNTELSGVFYLPVQDKYPYAVGKFSDVNA